ENLSAPEPMATSAAGEFLRGSTTYGNLSLVHRAGGSYGRDNAILDVRRDSKVIASLERDPTNGIGFTSYTFTQDGQSIISGGGAGRLYSYDLAAVEAAAKGGVLKGKDLDKLAHEFVGHEGVVWAVTSSADGKYLVSGSGDQTVRLWDMK